MMVSTDLFLDGIELETLNDSTRLIYADWLDEQGEPHKAEYLRLEAELAPLEVTHPEYTTKEAQLQSLRSQLDEEWIALVGRRYDLYLNRITAPPEGWLGQLFSFLASRWTSAGSGTPHRVLTNLSREVAEDLRDRLTPFAEVVIRPITPSESSNPDDPE